MIEIDIPTIDPMQHQPKIFLGMTSRQCLCIVPGVGLGCGLFALLYSTNQDLAVLLCGLCVTPAVLMGWYTPYNMKFEQYLKLLWFNSFVSNPKRIYKTDQAEEVKMMTIKERQDEEKKKKAEALAQRKNNKNTNNGKKEM